MVAFNKINFVNFIHKLTIIIKMMVTVTMSISTTDKCESNNPDDQRSRIYVYRLEPETNTTLNTNIC